MWVLFWESKGWHNSYILVHSMIGPTQELSSSVPTNQYLVSRMADGPGNSYFLTTLGSVQCENSKFSSYPLFLIWPITALFNSSFGTKLGRSSKTAGQKLTWCYYIVSSPYLLVVMLCLLVLKQLIHVSPKLEFCIQWKSLRTKRADANGSGLVSNVYDI
jgi:hypothetical protein